MYMSSSHSFRDLFPLDEGFEAVVVVGQSLVERVERLDGVGEGEEPPGSSGHRTDRSTRGGRGGWKD